MILGPIGSILRVNWTIQSFIKMIVLLPFGIFMKKLTKTSFFVTGLLVFNSMAFAQESRVNTDPNYNPDATLFKGAANNIWIDVLFKADPAPGSDSVRTENLSVDLRPDRDMTLNVEIYNPQ